MKNMLTHLAAAAALVVAGGQALAGDAGKHAESPGHSMNAPSQQGPKAPSDKMSSPADRTPPPSPSMTSPSSVTSPPGTSETPKAGRVAVDISPLRSDLAQQLNIDEDKVPATVSLPPGQAAQACGTSASELAPTTSTSMATCSAQEATSDLRDAVRSDLENAGQPGR